MSTVEFTHDPEAAVYFATKNGVKSGLVKTVVITHSVEVEGEPPVARVSYSIEVPQVPSVSNGNALTHRETVVESLVFADLDGAWAEYLLMVTPVVA